jgi:hypothetical protein
MPEIDGRDVSTGILAEVFFNRLGQNKAQPIGLVGDVPAELANVGSSLCLRADLAYERGQGDNKREKGRGDQETTDGELPRFLFGTRLTPGLGFGVFDFRVMHVCV